MMKRLYLDSCCFGRPFDDHSSDNVRLEAEAVRTILTMAEDSKYVILNSNVLVLEMSKNPVISKRDAVFQMLTVCKEYILFLQEHEQRWYELQELGIPAFDALHLALAEHANVDVFLTTDSVLLRKILKTDIRISCSNPLTFIVGEITS